MPAPTPRKAQNQVKRKQYAYESFARTEKMIKQAQACPCRSCIGAALTAAEGTRSAIEDARLWEGRLYGSDKRYPFTLRLKALDALILTIPKG